MRRLIPTVAVVSLSMSACVPRGRGGGEEEEDEDPKGNISAQQVTEEDYRNFCQAYEDCSPTAFEDYWGTVDSCVSYLTKYEDYYLDEYYPNADQACEDAFIALQFCYYMAEPTCTSMGFEYGLDDDACSGEYGTMKQACTDNNSGNNNGGGGGGLGGL